MGLFVAQSMDSMAPSWHQRSCPSAPQQPSYVMSPQPWGWASSHTPALQVCPSAQSPHELPQASWPHSAVPQSAGAALPPPQAPAVQVSPVVQTSPSSQGVPSGASPSVQVPLSQTATLQALEAVQSSSVLQLVDVPPSVFPVSA